MCKPNEQHLEVADKLEAYRDYGNPSGLNQLLAEAAALLRNSKPIPQEPSDTDDSY